MRSRTPTFWLLVTAATLVGACDEPETRTTPETRPTASAAPSASAKKKPQPPPPMKKGTRKLYGGKVLGEATPADLAAAVEAAGWPVESKQRVKSSKHVHVTTVAAKKKDGSTATVHVYEYAEPEWRDKRHDTLKKREHRETVVDGDYLLQVAVRKKAPETDGGIAVGDPDDEAAKALMTALFSSADGGAAPAASGSAAPAKSGAPN